MVGTQADQDGTCSLGGTGQGKAEAEIQGPLLSGLGTLTLKSDSQHLFLLILHNTKNATGNLFWLTHDFWVPKEALAVKMYICLSCTNMSRALNFHHSASDL